MTGRVYAVDPSAYRSADDAIDVATRIVRSVPDSVIRAVHRVLKIGSDAGNTRASVVAHVAGCLAATSEAVEDVLPSRSLVSGLLDFEGVSSTHCLGPVRLAVIEGRRPVQARALLETEFGELLAEVGLDLAPAYAALGVRPLPLPESAFEALARGEMTLAVADCVLASMPRELLEDASAARSVSWTDGDFGRRLYGSLFPGRHLSVGAEIFWRDAVVLASRAVTDFAEWRSLMTAYQSAVGDDEVLANVMESAVSSLVGSMVAVGR